MKPTKCLRPVLIISACWIVGLPSSVAPFNRSEGIENSTITAAGNSQPTQWYAGCTASSNRGTRTSDVDNHKSIRTGGGPCQYRIYSGYAKIVSVRLAEIPEGYSSAPYKGYEVRFRFFADRQIDEPPAQRYMQPQRLTLTNSWPPGPRFLEKYGIEEGKTFDCRLNLITRGVCTPVVFAFPNINLSDYFEIQSSK